MKSFSKIFAVLLLSSFGFTANATTNHAQNFSFEKGMMNEKRIEFKDLPQEAQSFIKEHFAAYQAIKIEKKLWPSKSGKLYEVDLNGGIELEFDKKGDWLEIETPRSVGVPEVLILQEIKTYVAQNYPEEKITSIAKKRYGFKIELGNDVDIKFNKQGGFLSIDY